MSSRGLHVAILAAALAAACPGAAQPVLQTAEPALPGAEQPSVLGASARALPADQVFVFNALLEQADTLVLMWEIREGYYLYRQSLTFAEAEGEDSLGEAEIPRGEKHHDEFFGDVEIFRDRLLVRLPITAASASVIDLEVSYQGCADIGYCYPAQRKSISVEVPR